MAKNLSVVHWDIWEPHETFGEFIERPLKKVAVSALLKSL